MVFYKRSGFVKLKKQLVVKNLCELCVQIIQPKKVLKRTAYQRMDKTPSKIILTK